MWFVIAQFLFLALLLWPSSSGVLGPVCLSVWLISLGLSLWTLWYNRPGNFNIHPTPKQTGQLVTDGPYRWIRHPMYSALLLFALGVVFFYHSWFKVLLWLLLLAVLVQKARREEQLLRARYASYAAYQARTAALCPHIY